MSVENLLPAPGKCIVLRDKEEAVTVGGIHLPDTAIDAACQGTVVAANMDAYWNGGQTVSPFITVGDRVFLGRYAGIQITYEGVEYVVLNYGEILAALVSAPVTAEAIVANA